MKKAATIIFILVLIAGTPNIMHAREKSMSAALGLSVLVPIAGCYAGARFESPELILLSFGIAPSLGHFYAGQWGRGCMFIGMRSLMMVGTLCMTIQSTSFYESASLFLTGACVCCIITLVDWFTVPSSVRKYNERFQIEPEIDLQDGKYGLGFSYRF